MNSKFKHIVVVCECGKEVILDQIDDPIGYYSKVSGKCSCEREFRVWADIGDVLVKAY